MQTSDKKASPRVPFVSRELQVPGRAHLASSSAQTPPSSSYVEDKDNFDAPKMTRVESLDSVYDDIELQELPSYDDSKANRSASNGSSKPKRTISRRIIIVVSILAIIALWVGWFVFSYHVYKARTWPVTPVWMNTHRSAVRATDYTLLLAAMFALALGIALLVSVRPRQPGQLRKPSRASMFAGGFLISFLWSIILTFLLQLPFYRNACGSDTPVPIYINGTSAMVYSSSSVRAALIENYSLTQTDSSSAALTLVSPNSSASSPEVAFNLASGTALYSYDNSTANFTVGAIGPVNFPAHDMTLGLDGSASMDPLLFSLRQSNFSSAGDIVMTGASRSRNGGCGIRICAAEAPSRLRQLFVPLGLVMYYSSQKADAC